MFFLYVPIWKNNKFNLNKTELTIFFIKTFSFFCRCLKLFKKEFIDDLKLKHGRIFDSQLL